MKKIISCSYKDDTPAFHSEEFFNAYKNGRICIPTKYGSMAVSLKDEDVACIVFWTKNPSDHFLKNMPAISAPFYIQWTITGYDRDIEPNVPDKDTIIQRFKKVADILGKERVWWRYDPILINDKYTVEYHKKRFAQMSAMLSGHTTRCVISFLDEYKKIQDRVEAGQMRAPALDEIMEMSASFADSAKKAGMTVQTCSEGRYDLTKYGIHEAPCIDARFIERYFATTLDESVKRPGGFRQCKCAANTDIGQYHRCRHDCSYCYAK